MATRIARIKTLMQGPLSASHVDIINESHMHGVPPESETHLKVLLSNFLFKNNLIFPLLGGRCVITIRRTPTT